MLNVLLKAYMFTRRKYLFPHNHSHIIFRERRFLMKRDRKSFVIFPCVVIILILLQARVVPSYAANGDKLWPSDGVPVVEATGDQKNFSAAPDGSGGVFVVWQSDANYDGVWNIYVQRLDADGDPVWPSPVLLSNPAQNAQKPGIVTSDDGYVIAAWISGTPGNVYAQRINSSGVLQWPAAVQLSTSCTASFGLDIAEGVNYGAFVVFTSGNARVVHIKSDGTLTTPGIDGIDLGASPVDSPVIDSYGVGAMNAFVAFSKSTAGNEDIVAQRIRRNMQFVGGEFIFFLDLPWGSTPVTISNDTRDERSPSIEVDSGQNAMIAWYGVDSAAVLSTQIRVQKIDFDGVCQWTNNGVVILNSSTAGGVPATWRSHVITTTVTTDDSGGAITAWNDWRNEPSSGGNDDIYAQRVFSAGTIAWSVNGVAVRSAAGTQRYPRIVSDGNGGGVVAWEDHVAFGPDIWAARLNGDSSKQWSKVIFQDGTPSDPGEEQREPQVVLDLVNNPCPPGSIVLWLDTRDTGGSYYDIYAQKVETTLDFPAGDFDYTGCENLRDFAIFSSAWLSTSGGTNWNAHCDISALADGVIDMLDLMVFAQEWLVCECQ